MAIDPDGRPDPDRGHIVLLSVGLSNATVQFSVFVAMATGDPDKNPELVSVDAAQGGISADWIINPDEGWNSTRFWTTVNRQRERAGETRLKRT